MSLNSIVGHRRIIDLLTHAVGRGRVPQSLLFAGPEGVGKRTTAIALAQAVNCPKRVAIASGGGDGCGACPTCVRIAKGQHSDVTLIEPGDAASLKIEVLRERLLEVVGYRPFEASRRIFIIDPADAMTPQAQDALLKTLEEPPTSAILILVTAYADTLHATIQSRCRRLRFGPLSESDVARVLTERCDVEPARAAVLAAASGGTIAAALAEDEGSLAEDRDLALELVVAAARRGPAIADRLSAAASFAQYEKSRRGREAIGTRLSLVLSLLRDIGAIRAGAGSHVANVDLESRLTDLSRVYDLPRLVHAFATVGEASNMLERYASPKIVADWVAITI